MELNLNSYRLSIIFFLALFLGLFFYALVVIGTAPVSVFGHDIPIFLDGGWRMYNGQIPHTDFHSAIGFLPYFLVAGGIKLIGANADALGFGNLIALIFIVIFSGLVSYKRLPLIYAVIFIIFNALIAGATNSIGLNYNDTTYAGFYNRYCFALINIVTLISFSSTEKNKCTEVMSGLLCGIAIFFMFITKINYFVFSFISMFLGGFLSRNWWFILSSLIFLCLSIFLTFSCFNIDYHSFYIDITYPMRQRLNLISFEKILDFYSNQIVTVCVVFFVGLICFFGKISEVPKDLLFSRVLELFVPFIAVSMFASLITASSTIPRIFIENPMIIVCSFVYMNKYYFWNTNNLFYTGNSQRNANILIRHNFNDHYIILNNIKRANHQLIFRLKVIYLFIKLILSKLFNQRGLRIFTFINQREGLNYFMFFLFFVSLSTSQVKTNFQSILYSYNQVVSKDYEFDYNKIQIPNLKRLIIKSGGGGEEFEEEIPYNEEVNLGGDLVKNAKIEKDMSLFVAHFSNPFSLGFGLTPLKGDNVYWSSDNAFVAPQSLFKDVDYVLWFKLIDRVANDYYVGQHIYAEFQKLYQPHIFDNYRLISENTIWALYKKRDVD